MSVHIAVVVRGSGPVYQSAAADAPAPTIRRFLFRGGLVMADAGTGPPGPHFNGGLSTKSARRRSEHEQDWCGRAPLICGRRKAPPGPPFASGGKAPTASRVLTVGLIRTILSIHENTKLAGGVAMGQFPPYILIKAVCAGSACGGRTRGREAISVQGIPGGIARFLRRTEYT